MTQLPEQVDPANIGHAHIRNDTTFHILGERLQELRCGLIGGDVERRYTQQNARESRTASSSSMT